MRGGDKRSSRLCLRLPQIQQLDGLKDAMQRFENGLTIGGTVGCLDQLLARSAEGHDPVGIHILQTAAFQFAEINAATVLALYSFAAEIAPRCDRAVDVLLAFRKVGTHGDLGHKSQPDMRTADAPGDVG